MFVSDEPDSRCCVKLRGGRDFLDAVGWFGVQGCLLINSSPVRETHVRIRVIVRRTGKSDDHQLIISRSPEGWAAVFFCLFRGSFVHKRRKDVVKFGGRLKLCVHNEFMRFILIVRVIVQFQGHVLY